MNEILYGNVMIRHLTKEDEIFLENEALAYDVNTNKYYVISHTLNEEIDLLNIEKLTIEEMKSLQSRIDSYILGTSIPTEEGALYIDKNSIIGSKNVVSPREIR